MGKDGGQGRRAWKQQLTANNTSGFVRCVTVGKPAIDRTDSPTTLQPTTTTTNN
ncbi:hypothetical protein [Tolypothrix sp. VBCCA 56010]|uniref:hypothetical protein n=1 Tax=Tolypothrix sp. VBCCA 56010 TaxID=3137731 RepID=UPI003D7DEEA8